MVPEVHVGCGDGIYPAADRGALLFAVFFEKRRDLFRIYGCFEQVFVGKSFVKGGVGPHQFSCFGDCAEHQRGTVAEGVHEVLALFKDVLFELFKASFHVILGIIHMEKVHRGGYGGGTYPKVEIVPHNDQAQYDHDHKAYKHERLRYFFRELFVHDDSLRFAAETV